MFPMFQYHLDLVGVAMVFHSSDGTRRRTWKAKIYREIESFDGRNSDGEVCHP